LKTTTKVLVGWIATAIVLSATLATAAETSAPADRGSADKARQTADLLQRARQAMAENDLNAADSLIARAEALGMQYNWMYQGDTPKKARHDLEKKRSALAAKPGGLLAPLDFNKDKTAPTADPFAGRMASAPSNSQVTLLPAVGTTAPAGSPVASTDNEKLLLAARRALAVGDVRHALELVRKERERNAAYQPMDDTPDKVEASIRKYQEISSIDKTTEAYRHAYANCLMDQAEALLRWNDYDEAERLAGRSAEMQVVYGPFEAKPQDVLQRIQAMRRMEPARSGAASAAPGYASAVPASSPQAPNLALRQQAVELVRQARQAIAAGQLDRAEMLARQAEQLNLPDAAFTPGEDRPGLLALDLKQLRQRQAGGVVPAGGQYVAQAGGNSDPYSTAARALYQPSVDRTRNVQASSQQPTPAYRPEPSQGMALYEQGEAALKAHDAARALELFRQAANSMNDMDPQTAQRLQDRLQWLSAQQRVPQPGQSPTMADEAVVRQQAAVRQAAAELAHAESNARALRETDPKAALAQLEQARRKVETSNLDTASRDQLLRSVDRAIGETRQIVERFQPQIERAEKNNQIRQDVERQQKVKLEVQEKLALLIDECNKHMDQQEYEKAEVLAKQAAELDPNNEIVTQLLWQTKFVRRFMHNQNLIASKEDNFIKTLESVDESSNPFDDRTPMVFGDAKQWNQLTKMRKKYLADRRSRLSEAELDIQKKLQMPVSMQFTDAPLGKVLDYLAGLTGVNLHLDPQGLSEEGIGTDTPVTINLRNDIMLKSALNLILNPLHLSYVIKDDVLKITSERAREGQVYSCTYNVADLVMPIPNFVPTQMGLASAYQGAMANVNMGFGGGSTFGSSTTTPMAVVASRDGKGNSASINSNLLAQISSSSSAGAGMNGMPKNLPVGSGPGGLGGGAQADFDSLIDLIKTTIKPQSWDDAGGVGSISPFETNLSLVVSQTQDVHEELADLLEQLRRLQDLQVTIEVRFITLNDNFFERVGLSFDFNIQDNIDGKTAFGQATATPGSNGLAINQAWPRNVVSDLISDRTVTVGLSSPNLFNANLDIPFTQNSYALAVPQFGGFDATAGAQLGFAILSDIEAFFFISAAQGDRRSNVLQAPKVTLFNGQQAFVSDTSQSPFVISVIPVVGDFAAAQQPVIVVLSEGTFMTVQAVVSNDRRFVRLTVVPFFSKIGDVQTFTFTGSTTTTTDTSREGLQASATDASKLWNKTADNKTTTNTGTTVQLPTFSFVTVTTTVSVPDGGTVLLGGIKRLSEGRGEYGVPMLDKIPYLNRLFKNASIGRETQSLMMMVTPRIIIQEEEEEKLGITAP